MLVMSHAFKFTYLFFPKILNNCIFTKLDNYRLVAKCESCQQQNISSDRCCHRYEKYLIVGLNLYKCMVWKMRQPPCN